MSTALLSSLVSRCRGLCLSSDQSDADLLRLVARDRDSVAFEALIVRHAALVWGVCRRQMALEADREDVFQATFLALVRQAGSLDPSRPLGGWLHTVAVRTAIKARAQARRQRAEQLSSDLAARATASIDPGSREWLRGVDEEIARLPESLRACVVLCCLEGRSRDEAADAIGCGVLAVKSRLERGRARLRTALVE